ncbi:monothiol bacilliredoxin BrxC family protein [Piscibacillus salipiscarius]|uniref:monothiol bacilliredoxin BrxC family protein n=1 Tax=Piscibacillus salipiscarius TaxID=299480 RepID=UPI0006D2A1C0|nr:monothiol bacilliredoxin BrxC family protein [Piscibacillus salipiscarius]
MKELTSVEEFKGVIEQQDQFVLLKHSLTCPISGEAKSQIEDFKSANEVPTYIIPIQNYRELSNYVSVFSGLSMNLLKSSILKTDKWNTIHHIGTLLAVKWKKSRSKKVRPIRDAPLIIIYSPLTRFFSLLVKIYSPLWAFYSLLS